MSSLTYKLYRYPDNIYEKYIMLLLYPWIRLLVSHLQWYSSGFDYGGIFERGKPL